jgi:urea transport system permease protein
VIKRILSTFLMLALFASAQAQEPPTDTAATADAVMATDLDSLLAALPAADLSTKQQLVAALAAEGSPAAHRTLTALLDARLYFRRTNRQIVIAAADSNPLVITDARSDEALGPAAAAEFERITINNQLRRVLRSALATMNLASPDRATRIAAVQEMMRVIDTETIQLLRDHLAGESDQEVRDQIATVLSIADLSSEDATQRLAAVRTLSSSLNRDVYNRLSAIATPGDDGTYAETDSAVLAAAQAAVKDIDGSRKLYATIEMLFFGLSLGSVLEELLADPAGLCAMGGACRGSARAGATAAIADWLMELAGDDEGGPD